MMDLSSAVDLGSDSFFIKNGKYLSQYGVNILELIICVLPPVLPEKSASKAQKKRKNLLPPSDSVDHKLK